MANSWSFDDPSLTLNVGPMITGRRPQKENHFPRTVLRWCCNISHLHPALEASHISHLPQPRPETSTICIWSPNTLTPCRSWVTHHKCFSSVKLKPGWGGTFRNQWTLEWGLGTLLHRNPRMGQWWTQGWGKASICFAQLFTVQLRTLV